MNPENKIVFMISADHGEAAPTVILGIPQAAWDYMKDGKTHTFDLTKAGLPMKLMLFGGPSHEDVLKTLEAGAAKSGIKITDERGKDWGIPE